MEFLLCPLANCHLAILLAKILHMSIRIQIGGLFVPLHIEVEGIDNIYAPVIIRHLSIGITTVTVIKIII